MSERTAKDCRPPLHGERVGREFGEPGAERRADESGSSEASEPRFDPTGRWPSAGRDLASDFVYERMARRDEIQLRRQFLRGLEKDLPRGEGAAHRGRLRLLAGPALWFVAG